jgi:hypothetical protein
VQNLYEPGQAIRLFVYHECTHISQAMDTLTTVGSLRRAYGPEIVSRIDYVADMIAAHSAAAVFLADRSDAKFRRAFLEAFRDYITLSVHILLRAFPPAGREPKMRRALSLLLTAAKCDLALSGADTLTDATSVAHAAIDEQGGALWAISPDESISCAVKNKPDDVRWIWRNLETAPAGELVDRLASILT